jgi:hypothetical protein
MYGCGTFVRSGITLSNRCGATTKKFSRMQKMLFGKMKMFCGQKILISKKQINESDQNNR